MDIYNVKKLPISIKIFSILDFVIGAFFMFLIFFTSGSGLDNIYNNLFLISEILVGIPPVIFSILVLANSEKYFKLYFRVSYIYGIFLLIQVFFLIGVLFWVRTLQGGPGIVFFFMIIFMFLLIYGIILILRIIQLIILYKMNKKLKSTEAN